MLQPLNGLDSFGDPSPLKLRSRSQGMKSQLGPAPVPWTGTDLGLSALLQLSPLVVDG